MSSFQTRFINPTQKHQAKALADSKTNQAKTLPATKKSTNKKMEFGSIRQENDQNLSVNKSSFGQEDNVNQIEFNLDQFKSASQSIIHDVADIQNQDLEPSFVNSKISGFGQQKSHINIKADRKQNFNDQISNEESDYDSQSDGNDDEQKIDESNSNSINSEPVQELPNQPQRQDTIPLDCSSDASSEEQDQKEHYMQMLNGQIEIDRKKQEEQKQKFKHSSATFQITPYESQNESLIDKLTKDTTIDFYPSIIENNPEYSEHFQKQFDDIIGKRLKQKLEKINNLSELQQKFKQSDQNKGKKCIIINLDDCFLKTSIFENELPRIDGQFNFQKLKVYTCFRNFMKEFLFEAQQKFEVIVWTSSQKEYSHCLIDMLEQNTGFKFDYVLTLQEQQNSEEKDFYVKNIDILTGEGGREENNILFLDNQMSSYTNRLTNGIHVPFYRLHNDHDDNLLQNLLKYLGEFIIPNLDSKTKIKSDFQLLDKFNGFKQTQAFLKIKKTLEEVMEEN